MAKQAVVSPRSAAPSGRFVAFLRGINVGKAKRVAMASLCSSISTFESPSKTRHLLKKTCLI